MRRAQGPDGGLMTACSFAASTKSLRDRPLTACVVSDRLTRFGASGRSPDDGSLARQSRPAGRGTPALDRPPPGTATGPFHRAPLPVLAPGSAATDRTRTPRDLPGPGTHQCLAHHARADNRDFTHVALAITLERIVDLAGQLESPRHHAHAVGMHTANLHAESSLTHISAQCDVISGAILDDYRTPGSVAEVRRRAVQNVAVVDFHTTGRHRHVYPARTVVEDAFMIELRGKRAVLRKQMISRTPLVASRNRRAAAVFLRGIIEEDHDGEQIEVGVREKRMVLVPFEARVTTARRLQVELGVQLDVRPDQVLHHVQDFGLQDQVMECLVTHDGVEDATHGVAAAVGTRDRALVVGLRQGFGVSAYPGRR